jgi:preprotein translocase subunit SecG
VPFPLHDKGETARNAVMIAHMETPPPNLFTLRGKALPDTWSSEKRENEMRLPEWVFNMVYRCLEKKPEDRFASGMALYDYIVQNRTWSNSNGDSNDQIKLLQQENRRLLEQNRDLQHALQQLHTGKTDVAAFAATNTISLEPAKKKSNALKVFLWIVAGLFVAAIFIYAVQTNYKKPVAQTKKIVQQDSSQTITPQQEQQLQNAKSLLKENKEAALDMYEQLSNEKVPQAMFVYANLALKNQNSRMACSDAFNMMGEASDKNYLPAKTTMGILYAFANDDATLKELDYYTRCVFPYNVTKGAKLLMEASLQGDATAAEWLKKLNEKIK